MSIKPMCQIQEPIKKQKMGFSNQLRALFYKNSIMIRRNIKLHFMMLLLTPFIACTFAILKELGSFGQKKHVEKWSSSSDLTGPKKIIVDNSDKFVIVNALEGIKDKKGGKDKKKHIPLSKKLVQNLISSLGDLHFPEADLNGITDIAELDKKYQTHQVEQKKNLINGAFFIKDISNDKKGHLIFDIVLETIDPVQQPFMLAKLDQALLRTNNISGSIEHSNYVLSNSEDLFSIMIPNPLLASLLVSSFIPSVLFATLMLKEKEERVFLLMRLNGLKISGYFFGQLLWFLLIYLFPLLIISASLTFYEGFKPLTAQGLLSYYMLFMNGFQVSSLSIFVSAVSKRVGSAVPSIFFLSSFLPTISLYTASFGLPEYLVFVPLFGFCRTFAILLKNERDLLQLLRLPVIWMGILGLNINVAIFFLGAVYIANITDQNNSGITRPWHFFITDFFNKGKKKTFKIPKSQLEGDVLDDDVKDASFEVDNDPEIRNKKLLVIEHVSKQYKGGKLAIIDVCFALESDMIFGLLGPNGAGKSTLMQIAGGLYHPSSGRVFISGICSEENPEIFFKTVGFCPQHDIYWRDLTVSEHLKVFELLRGTTNSKLLDKKVIKGMEGVRLVSYTNALASSLSGGERRRLSLAIALAGDSKVVLLDEPTTGLDPKVRRIVWDIIGEAGAGRLIILTTHSMEEAELLSHKITIMAHGRLRCFGTPDHLKHKFGGQIFINVSCISGRINDSIKGIKSILPDRCSVALVHESSDKTNARLVFDGSKKDLLDLMLPLLERKKEFFIESFGVNQSSLDDVFMNIVKEADADA